MLENRIAWYGEMSGQAESSLPHLIGRRNSTRTRGNKATIMKITRSTSVFVVLILRFFAKPRTLYLYDSSILTPVVFCLQSAELATHQFNDHSSMKSTGVN